MLALVSSAAAGLYKLLGLALGGGFSVSVAADLAHALAVASVAAVLAAYHWRVIRADAQAAQLQPTETVETIETAAPDATASAIVEIRAADAAGLSRAISALRSTGAQVTVIPAVASSVRRP